MKKSPLKYLPGLALGIFSIASTAQAALITTIPDLPPLGGVYLSTDVHQIFGGPALEFILSLPEHAPIAAQVSRREGGLQADGSIVGTPADEIEGFGSTLEANLEIKQNGITTFNGPITTGGPVKTMVLGKIGNVTGDFSTEMLAMDLAGGSLPPGVMIRESPTKQSLGQTKITDIGGGLYQIDSFFDVFTELSIDGGLNWMPSNNGSGHVELVPEPTSVCLLAIGLVFGTVGYLRRRR